MIHRPPLGRTAVLALTTLIAACGPAWKPAFDEKAPAELFESVAIADPDVALTFARVAEDGQARVIGVGSYRGGAVEGVDLAAALGRDASDPITLFGEVGYERLRDLLRDPPESARVSVPAASLVSPVDLRDHHVAAGTNYPEHADDAGVEDGPFLFAKMVDPTGPYNEVPAGAGLLDYEAEVAWVTLAPLPRGAAPEAMGVVLCNDFTDRETLMRHIDPWDIASGRGFTTGKSFPGFLPVGNLFVIPRDPRGFFADLELRLYVDGALRQRSSAREMVWDLDEILAQTWARADQRWEHRGEQVSLFGGGGAIPARTLLLSGTPHGTVFDGLSVRHYIRGLARWLLGGWSEPVPSRVVDVYIADAKSAGAYLQPGNRVDIHVDHLGVLRNSVIR
jgi:2-keto-4-pentenoate hydratase/2-oxohepta-3-ene-1,7-dioic acid hydratase in catechol pathway